MRLDLIRRAGQQLRQAGAALRNLASVFKVNVEGIEFGVGALPGIADTGDLQQDLPQTIGALAEAAANRGTPVAIIIDEVQYLSKIELAALIVSFHEVAQRGWPLHFVGAGLPQIAALAGNAKSYAERLFNYPEVGSLGDEEARRALITPIRDEEADIDDDAAQLIVAETEGYPYFIQEWGSQVWNHAPTNRITCDDVNASAPQIMAHLDANFFRVRYDRLTPLQQKYLRAMAELGAGPHQTGEIAATLGVEAREVGTTRAQLIGLGMIWSQRHGETAFTVPQFDGFMRRQIPVLEPHSPKRRRRRRN